MGKPENSRQWDATTRAAERGERATLRVERTSRERHNVLVGASLTPPRYDGSTVLVVRVTGAASDNGIHPAKLYELDTQPQLNDPPDPIVWEEVTGDVGVKPMPGQTLEDGDTGVAVFVGMLGETAVYALGGPAAVPNCRTMLVGKGPDSALTGTIPAGVGKCASVGPETVYFAYDGGLDATYIGYWGGWVSTPFTTRLGATTAAVYLDDRGEPAAELTAAASGSGGPFTRPMTYVGCDSSGRMRFVTFDCLWCDDYWVGPCGENQFELLVECGVAVCDPEKVVPALLAYDLTLVDAVPGDEHFAGTLTFGYVRTGFEAVMGTRHGVASWGADYSEFGGYLVLIDQPWNGFCMRLEYWADAEDSSYTWIAGVAANFDFPWSGNFTGDLFSSSLAIDAVEVTDADVDLCGDTIPPCSACYDGTGEPLEAHPDLEIVVPDGDYSGTRTLTWSGSYWQSAVFDPGVGNRYWRLTCAAGTWTLEAWKDDSPDEIANTGTATAQACRPFGLVFAGTDFIGTSDITIGLAA